VTIELSKKTRACERIGVIGSPSSNTSISVDVTEEAYQKSLVGNFCVLEFVQDGNPTYPIGQIVSIKLQNPYLERHSVRKIISVRGEASPLTERHDVRLIELIVGSCFRLKKERVIPSIMGSVPPTGTNIYLINQEIIDELTKQNRKEINFIGHMYNTGINLPMIFRHFGKGAQGLGEAYHIGIFGKTGSGKSYLARMILAIYAKHPEMSILLIDPQGEYSKEIRSGGQLAQILETHGKGCEVFNADNIRLTSISSLARILLISGFIDALGARAEENQKNAAELIGAFFLVDPPKSFVDFTGRRVVCTLENSTDEAVFTELMNYIAKNIQRIYVSQEGKNRVLERIRTERSRLFSFWLTIARLFSQVNKSVSDSEILDRVSGRKNLVIIDLSEAAATNVYWNEMVQSIVIKDVLANLEKHGSELFRQGKSFNLLVATDEAHRLIPREKPIEEDFRELKRVFIDCVRTTRKYGLGWMFISQSLASIDSEILRQLRLYFFGYGLSWGLERRVLEELIGRGAHIDLYQSFKDPQTAAIIGEKKEFPFMVYGPVSPLSASGAPLFFTALHYVDEYPKINNFRS
jgi:hypothetical protein